MGKKILVTGTNAGIKIPHSHLRLQVGYFSNY
jgi:hypothetical protein